MISPVICHDCYCPKDNYVNLLAGREQVPYFMEHLKQTKDDYEKLDSYTYRWSEESFKSTARERIELDIEKYNKIIDQGYVRTETGGDTDVPEIPKYIVALIMKYSATLSHIEHSQLECKCGKK